MALIEGVGDDVITLVFVLFTVVLVIMSWLSTNVREFAFPANLLVIERRSRRLFTTNNLNGNINIMTAELSTSPTTSRTSTSINNNLSNVSSIISSESTASTSTNTVRIINTATRTSTTRLNNLDLVNEMVEQALVDNLLDGEFYTAHDIQLIPSNNSVISNDASSGINSGNGQAVTSMNTIFENNSSEQGTNVGEVKKNEIAEDKNEQDLGSTSDLSSNEDLINILVKFVNEKEMKIKAKPNDTILLLKKAYFSKELSNNKIVRFIYQGQFLVDTNTIKSYNIKDQTTIHCHITSKPGQQQTSQENTSTTTTTVTSTTSTRQRINNQPLTVNNQPIVINQSEIPVASVAPIRPNQTTFTTVISIDLNKLLLPIFAVGLGACWYFRINFKHLFSPLSTLILVIFTFLYAVFLFNNIHSTSAIAANRFLLRNRILQRRQPEQQETHETVSVPAPEQTQSQ